MAAADGTNQRQLTNAADGVADLHPRWLPDGSGVIFSQCDGGQHCAIHIVAADGSNDHALLPADDRGIAHPVWQPPTASTP